MVNPYHLTEVQAVFYTKIKFSQFKKLAIPFLQYSEDSPRFYRKEDLDSLVKNNIKNLPEQEGVAMP